MLRVAFLSLFLKLGLVLPAQVLVINELDCDTPGIDDKEFVEIRSETPHFDLDGYVLVFFNGSAAGGNASYLVLDLDGYTTDINGLLLIGSTTIVPAPQYIISPNVIQNGADAVAIYQANAQDFPTGTVAYVNETLVDVLIYGTNDPDAIGLIAIFQAFNPSIAQINEGPANNTNSIQRNNDGTYFAGVPTPRRLNDGSGIALNGLATALAQTRYNEGDSMVIVFTAEQSVVADLTFSLSLSNGTFNASDFMGDTVLTLLAGQNSVSTTIQLIDDDIDEGDEEPVIRLAGLPPTILILNDNIRLRVVDNDFRMAPFGTPIQPTYGVVAGTQPPGYYDALNGLAGDDLRRALQNIIADPAVVRAQTYADVIDILKEADQNPLNSNQVWLVYLEQGRAKLDFQTSSSNIGVWNREHTFPRSRGGFDSISADTLADGRDAYWHTNADSLRHANSDAHGIRAVSAEENNSRGNKFYGQYVGPPGTLGGFRGDVARCIFYLDIRYNGLEVVNGFPEGMTGKFGDLATLLEWHRNDPPDDYEMNRNNVVYSWQYNRNPFIDMPNLVEYFWGNRTGEVWQQPSSTGEAAAPAFKIFPNPAQGNVQISGIAEPSIVRVYSLHGRLLSTHQVAGDATLGFQLPSGMYLVQLSSNGKTAVQKLIVQ